MIEALADLEKRKLKPIVRASGIIIGLSCLIIICISLAWGIVASIPQVLPFLLLPVAMVLGAASALFLRKEPERSAQEFLPISPVRKIFTAYSIQLKYVLALLLAEFFLSGFQGISLQLGALGSSGFWIFAGVLIYLNAATFFFCYWLGQPVLACGLAFFVSGGLLSLVMAAREEARSTLPFSDFFPAPLVVSLNALYWVSLVITFGAAIAIVLRSARSLAGYVEVQHRTPVLFKLRITAAILAPALLPATLLGISIYGKNIKANEFKPVTAGLPQKYHDTTPYAIPGTIVISGTGKIAHVDSKGKVFFLYDEPDEAKVLDVEINQYGYIWALIQPAGSHLMDVYVGQPGEALAKAKSLLIQEGDQADLTVINGQFCIRYFVRETTMPIRQYIASSVYYRTPTMEDWSPRAPEGATEWDDQRILLKKDENYTWVLRHGNEFVKRNASNAIVGSLLLPGKPSKMASTDGIYYESERKLYLVDWDFHTRAIMSLRFN